VAAKQKLPLSRFGNSTSGVAKKLTEYPVENLENPVLSIAKEHLRTPNGSVRYLAC